MALSPNTGLEKKFIQVCIYNVTGQPEQTFWPTQYNQVGIRASTYEFREDRIQLIAHNSLFINFEFV